MINIVLDNGKRLQLPDGANIEIERSSPFFSTGLEWAGERSTTLTIPYSPSNAQALGYPFVYYTKRINKSTAAFLYDGAYVRQKGFIKTENAVLNKNHIAKSELSGFFLFSLSSFFQLIKDKKLRSLSLGGVRTFAHTTFEPYDNSNGFWQYIHGTWQGDKDFLVAPIRNEGIYESDETPVWLNQINFLGDIDGRKTLDNDTLVPQLRLKYILTQIFEEYGYKVSFDIGDVQWETLFLVSLIPFKWRRFEPRAITIPNPPGNYPPGSVLRYIEWFIKDTIEVKLADHLPDRSIADFLINAGNYYGWRYLINDDEKTCIIKSFKQIKKGAKKDWTNFADANTESEFTKEAPVVSFITDVDSNDSKPVKADFDGLILLPAVVSFIDLPSAVAGIFANVCYTHVENSYWQVDYDGALYYWKFFSDNIFSYEPENSTESIQSSFSTLPIANVIYRQNIDFTTNYYGLFPIMKQLKNKDFGFRTLLYHGMIQETLANGSDGPEQYAHLSSLWRKPGDPLDAIWSNVFVHDYNEIKRGVINYWWKEWLSISENTEETKLFIRLPRHELINFKWDDIIIVNQIPHLVKTIVEPCPYKGQVLVTLKRID